MMFGMTVRSKIAVSLPSSLVEEAKAAVAQGRAPSVSAYVERALEERVKLDALGTWLDELLAETGGPLTDAERAEIDKEAGWA
jgi:Arc/MetJ-type ribon-helix-helix transcriptional regulator